MSHTSTYKHKVKEIARFINIAAKLGYAIRAGEEVIVKHFNRTPVNAEVGITIPGWKYEIAITESGEILYDHWGSGAGTMEKLGTLIQTYNEEVLTSAIPYDKLDNCYNTKQENGDIKMVLEYA